MARRLRGTFNEIEHLVDELGDLHEYLNGPDDAIVDDKYEKEYTDTYMVR